MTTRRTAAALTALALGLAMLSPVPALAQTADDIIMPQRSFPERAEQGKPPVEVVEVPDWARPRPRHCQGAVGVWTRSGAGLHTDDARSARPVVPDEEGGCPGGTPARLAGADAPSWRRVGPLGYHEPPVRAHAGRHRYRQSLLWRGPAADRGAARRGRRLRLARLFGGALRRCRQGARRAKMGP